MRERRGRAKLFVDGEFYAEIDAEALAGSGLGEGDEVPDAELDSLREAGEKALAMRRAFNLLSYRPRSEGELRERLARYGHGEGVVESVMERLGELGYLDDGEFARNLARQKSRKYGPRRVSMELQRAGVDPEVASGAVEEEFSGRDELAEARKAATDRYNIGSSRRSASGGEDALARKVYGFLTRRGYSAGVCAEVAREYRTGDR